MAARFAVVSGRSNGRGKCENLEKIAFRKRQKLYVLYLDKNYLIGFMDTSPCVKFKLCKQTIFSENKHKEFLKNISGLILNFNCFYLKENWPRRNATQSYSENKDKEFLKIFFLK